MVKVDKVLLLDEAKALNNLAFWENIEKVSIDEIVDTCGECNSGCGGCGGCGTETNSSIRVEYQKEETSAKYTLINNCYECGGGAGCSGCNSCSSCA